MAFDETQFPVLIGRGAKGGPMRRTQIVTMASGDEERNASWLNSRRAYDISSGIRSAKDLAVTIAFWEARNARLRGFRFKDWSDYKSSVANVAVTALDQAIGTGTGALTTFQLVKAYTSGSQTWTRTITKPVSGTVKVAVAGTEMFSGWTVNTTTGLITFAVAPAAASTIKAGFEFDVPVRFDTDDIPVVLDFERQGSIASIPLIEVRR